MSKLIKRFLNPDSSISYNKVSPDGSRELEEVEITSISPKRRKDFEIWKKNHPNKSEEDYIKMILHYGDRDKQMSKLSPNKIVSDLYKETSGPVYDIVNAGLYAAAPFTGGTTLVPAMIMSGALGLGALANAKEEGWNTNNGLDVASAIPGFGLGEKSIPYMMKLVGKNMKYAKHFTKYPYLVYKGSSVLLSKGHPWYEVAMKDSKYIPGAVAAYSEDALNHVLNGVLIYNDYK